jgi:hypothetical protein
VKGFAATMVAVLTAVGAVSAHRLDEYLQATRVSIARDQLALEVDLTPGVSIAQAIVESVDTNADNAISPAEAETYGRNVLSDLLVQLDGGHVAMSLTRIETPTIEEMRTGLGTIRLRAAGSVEVVAGEHQVSVFNNHRPDTSVYMVNALVPDDRGIDIVSQSRDLRQREFRMQTTVRRQWLTPMVWLGIGGAGLVVAVKLTKNEKRKTNREDA